MSEDNELSPEIEASLRDISAVDPTLRDQHIAAALGEIASPAASNGRLRFLSVAAAVVVLVAGGIAVAQNSEGNSPAIAADTAATSVPKASGECTHSGGFWGDVGSVEKFMFGDTAYELVLRNGTVEILLGTSPCTRVDVVVYYEEMRRRDNQKELPTKTTCEQKPLVQFSDNSGGPKYALALLETSDGVSLFFEDRCNEPLGSIALPQSSD
jgi:hypothetical protein